MDFYPNELFHFYNRGNNKNKIFFNIENYYYFLRKVRKYLLPYCEIFTYCLMPNHFHFLIYTKENLIKNTLNTSIGILLSSYTKAINIQEKRTGSLFQQDSKAKSLTQSGDEYYPFICFNYIHQNPMKAGLVKRMEDWEFSSFNDYLELKNSTLVNKSLAIEFLDLPEDEKEFYEMSYKIIDDDNIKDIF